jgi:hypothetical protein
MQGSAPEKNAFSYRGVRRPPGDAIASGTVYVYVASDGGFEYDARLFAPDGASADLFGESVATLGDHVFVGAPWASPAAFGSGAVYVFARESGGDYAQTARLMAGNAVAVHDIEAAIYGTTLGMTDRGVTTVAGHGSHMRAINKVCAAGSIEAAVESGLISRGIMHALVRHRIPYVLAGSIRDDGPLPGVITDTVAAQDAMRDHTVRATGAVFVATALHAIAVGNMLPSFHTHRGAPEHGGAVGPSAGPTTDPPWSPPGHTWPAAPR